MGAREKSKKLKYVIVVDGEEPDGLEAYARDAEPLDFGTVECEREDPITVFYTSGTSGAPKGCMLHHGWWLRVIDLDMRMFRRGWQDRQLCCLPFYYADPAIQLLDLARLARHDGGDAAIFGQPLLGSRQ